MTLLSARLPPCAQRLSARIAVLPPVSFGLTKAQLRRLRKRARVVRSTDGGYTSHRGAQQHLEAKRAELNGAGELVFRAPLRRFIERPYDPVDGYRFRWYADQSGGVAVMKALSHDPLA